MVQGGIGTFEGFVIAKRASSGYYMGQAADPENVSNGTTTSAYYYDKAVDMQFMGLEYAMRTMRAGTRIWSSKVAGVSNIANSPLNLSAFDTVLDGLLKGYTPDTTTNSNHTILTRNANKIALQNFGLIAHIRFDRDNGAPMWLNVVKLNVQLMQTNGPTAGFGEGENPSPLEWQIKHDRSSKNILGQNFSAANARPTDDTDYEWYILSDYRFGLTTYVDDGSATSYILGHRPATATKGLHFIFKNGVDNASGVSSINASTGSTAITAGTAGDKWHHLYPTDFVAI